MSPKILYVSVSPLIKGIVLFLLVKGSFKICVSFDMKINFGFDCLKSWSKLILPIICPLVKFIVPWFLQFLLIINVPLLIPDKSPEKHPELL